MPFSGRRPCLQLWNDLKHLSGQRRIGQGDHRASAIFRPFTQTPVNAKRRVTRRDAPLGKSCWRTAGPRPTVAGSNNVRIGQAPGAIGRDRESRKLLRFRGQAARTARSMDMMPRSRTQWPSTCRPAPASQKNSRCAPASESEMSAFVVIQHAGQRGLVGVEQGGDEHGLEILGERKIEQQSMDACRHARPPPPRSGLRRCFVRLVARLENAHLVPLPLNRPSRGPIDLGLHRVAKGLARQQLAKRDSSWASMAGSHAASPSNT